MDMDLLESRPERGEERYQDESAMRDPWKGGYDDLEENGIEKSRESSKHRSKDSKKSSRREEKDYRSKDKERTKTGDSSKDREKESKDLEKDRVSSRERRKEERDEREKDKSRDKIRDKDYDRDKFRDKEDRGKEKDRDKDRKDRGKEKDRERDREIEKDSDRGRDKERGKEKNRDRDKERDKERDKTKEREREREKEREKHKDREKEKESETYRDRDSSEREKVKEKIREKEADYDKERSRDRDKVHRKNRDEGHDKGKDGKDDMSKFDVEDQRERNLAKKHHDEDYTMSSEQEQNAEATSSGSRPFTSELGERIIKMKEERLKNKSESVPEVLAWVNRSRKLEDKRNAEKEKAMQLSRIFEEQDNIDQGESEDEEAARHTSRDLAGVKVLHGLDKVMEGGAVVLTLKDQSILADGDINEGADVLENVEIGEQKQRDDAYKAAKKKTGIYEDKFNDDPGFEKKMLPQYDDSVVDEGVTLDERGRFTGEAEKKLEELRRKLQSVSSNYHFEDLSSSGKISSEYYTHEEMLQFKKPKKKKSLRKKEKLDVNALEAEAISAGLGVGDLGSRNDGKRQAIREEQDNFESEMKRNAYQSAYAKADEASKALRLEQTVTVKPEEDGNTVFADDDDDLYKSLESARKLALKKQNENTASGPQAIALLAKTSASSQNAEEQNPTSGEPQENKVVFTEMEEFVWGLQLDEEAHNPDNEDVFMEEDDEPKAPAQEVKDEPGGWTEVKDTTNEEDPVKKDNEERVLDETIHEVPVGKGLSGALKLLQERGSLKETVEWGGRNMDKKKSKLVGINDNNGQKEIRIERTDEFGRIMTPKEAFRMISHKFHGKGPGKMKLEKRMKQYEEEIKLKKMKNSDTPSLSVERMREAQAQLKSPYLVLSGHVKPGQTSDPRSGFATVEKEFPGSLTPMLGDRKVEHFLGIKRKPEPGDMGPPKKPKA